MLKYTAATLMHVKELHDILAFALDGKQPNESLLVSALQIQSHMIQAAGQHVEVQSPL